MKKIGYVQGLEIGTQNDRTKFWEFALCTIVPTITGILRIVPKFLWPISKQKREWMYSELAEKRQQSVNSTIAHKITYAKHFFDGCKLVFLLQD